MLSTHPLLSDRVRLSIMGILGASEKPVSFNDLLEALGLSKGNLSTHLKKLEDEKLITVEKQFVERKPRTTYGCTPAGREALQQYLEQVQHLLQLSKK